MFKEGLEGSLVSLTDGSVELQDLQIEDKFQLENLKKLLNILSKANP